MKEMTWSKEEVVRRLAILRGATNKAAEEGVANALDPRNASEFMENFHKVNEIISISTGFLMVADAFGIDPAEVVSFHVTDEETEEFMNDVFLNANNRKDDMLGDHLADSETRM